MFGWHKWAENNTSRRPHSFARERLRTYSPLNYLHIYWNVWWLRKNAIILDEHRLVITLWPLFCIILFDIDWLINNTINILKIDHLKLYVIKINIKWLSKNIFYVFKYTFYIFKYTFITNVINYLHVELVAVDFINGSLYFWN